MIGLGSSPFRRAVVFTLFTAFFGVLYGHYLLLSRPGVYRASAKMQLPAGHVSRRQVSSSEGDPRPEFLEDIYALRSDKLARQVVNELQLTTREDFLGDRAAPLDHSAAQELRTRNAIDTLEDNFDVTIVPRTDIIELTFLSRRPDLAATVLNRLAQDFIADRYERRFAQSQRGQQMVLPRLETLRDKFNGDQVELLKLQETLHTPGFSPRTNGIAKSMDALAREITQERLRGFNSEAQVRLLAAQPPADRAQLGLAAAAAGGDLTLASLRAQRAQTAVQLARSSVLLGPENPQEQALVASLASLDEHIRAEGVRLLEGARLAAAIEARDQAGLQGELRTQTADATALAPAMERYAELEREYVHTRSLYYNFMYRIKTQSLSAALAQANVFMVDPAEAPTAPIPLAETRDLVVYALFSGGSGLLVWLLIFGRRDLEARVNATETMTGLPVLQLLPASGDLTVTKLADAVREGAPGTKPTRARRFIDALFNLRGALASLSGGSLTRCYLVTSSRPGEGKTTVSSGLAVAMARGGARVLLIDADLHKPAVAARFGLPNRLGLTTILDAGASLTDAVQPVPGTAGLDVLTAGPISPAPDLLLSSDRMRTLLAEAGRTYAYVIIDSPPVLAVHDSLILAKLADRVIWIVRDGYSQGTLTQRTRRLLEEAGAPVCGVVLNAFYLTSAQSRRLLGLRQVQSS